jgi:molybdate transport system substrate-binding protein
MKHLLRLLIIATLLSGGTFTAFGQTEISVDTPLPTRDSFEKLIPGFEAKTGYKVKLRIGNGVGTKQEAEKGEPYDVFVILPPFDAAMKSGNLDPKTATTLGYFVLGLTVKKGTPLPDISTGASVKRALVNAKSMVTVDPTQGSVGVATGEAMTKMGITEQVKGKIKYVANGGLVSKSVTDGESEIGMGPYVSDLMGNKNPDLVIVGGLPKDASTPTAIVAVVSTHAKDPAAAKALIQYLNTPEADAVYKSMGIMPAH